MREIKAGTVDNYMIRSGRIALCKELGISESSSYGVISEYINKLKADNARLTSMIDNGLGWDDMKGGSRSDVE